MKDKRAANRKTSNGVKPLFLLAPLEISRQRRLPMRERIGFLTGLAGILFLLASPTYGEATIPRVKMLMLPRCHMCHDPFIPRDHLVLVPDDDLIRMEREGEFRIYMENTFHTPLREVKLVVENPAFDIEVKPRVLEKLVPGERIFFLIKLKLREGYKLGDYPLRISVSAREAILSPSIETVKVVADEVISEPQVQPTPEVIVPEVAPEVKPVEPVIPPKEEVRQKDVVEPPVEERVEPQAEEAGEIVVRVEEKPFWREPYFYLVLLVVLLGLIFSRKLKRK